MFYNDYVQWFTTVECSGRYYCSVFDRVFRFEPFKVTPLATIPDYPNNQKTNHKLTSWNNRLFVTNGTDVYEFIEE